MQIQYRIDHEQVEIVRCFGTDPQVVLPAEIAGYPVRRVAAYAFSARKAKEDTDVLVYDMDDSVFSDGRYLLAGNEIESVHFPDTVEQIGNYIFYGCKFLRELEFSDALKQVGSGAFTGCGQLSDLKVHLWEGQKSCVKEILGDLWQRIDVTFYFEQNRSQQGEDSRVFDGQDRSSEDDEAQNRASLCCSKQAVKLVFPEHYEEAVENTPARILFTQHHGTGNNYRQCFYDREMDYRKYDELFPFALVQDKLEVLADMVFYRLEYPYDLRKEHESMYEEYIGRHLPEVADYLIRQEMMGRLLQISRRGLWNEKGLDEAIRAAAELEKGEVLSFLMNEKHLLFSGKRRKQFDL